MSAKRSAPYQIDQKTLQQKQIDHPNQQAHSQPKNNKTETKQRQILHVKKDKTQQDEPNKQTKDNNQQQKQTTSLFSGSLFSNNNKINVADLFGTNAGLFINTTPSIFTSGSNSLFSNKKTDDSNAPKSGGLFSSSNTPSLFNFLSSGVPPVKNTSYSLIANQPNQNQGDEGDSAELEAAQNIQIDPSKSTANYQYQQGCNVILNGRAFKYKKNGGQLVENVEVIVQQDLKTKIYYLIVRLPATKKQICTGLIVEKKSQVKHINNKKQNVQIIVLAMGKQKKMQQSSLRFQFQKPQAGSNLKETVEKIIDGTYQSKQTTSEHKEQVKQESKQKQETSKEAVNNQ